MTMLPIEPHGKRRWLALSPFVVPLLFAIVPGCGAQAPEGPGAGGSREPVDEAASAESTCVLLSRGTVGNVQDALIRSDTGESDGNFGSSNSLAASMSSSTTRHALVQWDVGSIPSNATVISATATLSVFLGGDATVRAHVLTTPWSESTVTWQNYAEAIPSRPAAANFPAGTPTQAGDLTQVVQDWVSGATPNQGILLERDDAPGTTTFLSSESPSLNQRPTLKVCYAPPPNIVPGAPQDQIISLPGAQIDVVAGTSVTVNGSPVASPFRMTIQKSAEPNNTPTGIPTAPPSTPGDETSFGTPVLPVLQLGPSGATFSPPIQVTLDLPPGLVEPTAWLCDDAGVNCQVRAGIFYTDSSVSPPQDKLYLEVDHFSKVVVTNHNPLGITYHGGPVMKGPVNLYYIWYGPWAGNTATSILTSFAQNLGGSPYFDINTGYTDAGGQVSGALTYAGSTNTPSSAYGTSLTTANIQQVVSDAIVSARLPSDPSGIYVVLTAPSVAVTGFCSQYCGFHNHAVLGGVDIKYALVGDAASQCPNGCIVQSASMNGNAGADGMASVIAHELSETVSDPDSSAWSDSTGQENADKCAWNFGTTYLANGAKANVKLGGKDYLIQQNWDPVKGACSLSAPVFNGCTGQPNGTACNAGNACSAQPAGAACVAGTDCASGTCSSGTCQALAALSLAEVAAPYILPDAFFDGTSYTYVAFGPSGATPTVVGGSNVSIVAHGGGGVNPNSSFDITSSSLVTSITESGTTRSTFIVNAGSIFFDGTFDPNPGNATHTIPAGNTVAFGVGFSEGLGSSSWYASVDGNHVAYSANVPVHAFRAPISSGSTHTVMGAGYAGGPLGLQAAYWGYANDSAVCQSTAVCMAQPTGAACVAGTDCASGTCSNGTCQALAALSLAEVAAPYILPDAFFDGTSYTYIVFGPSGTTPTVVGGSNLSILAHGSGGVNTNISWAITSSSRVTSITESGTTRSTFIVNAGSIFFDGTFDPNPGNATHTIPAGNTLAFGVGFSEGLGSSSWYASVDGNHVAYSANVRVHAFRAPISSGSTHTVMGAGYTTGPLGIQAAYWGYASDAIVCQGTTACQAQPAGAPCIASTDCASNSCAGGTCQVLAGLSLAQVAASYILPDAFYDGTSYTYLAFGPSGATPTVVGGSNISIVAHGGGGVNPNSSFDITSSSRVTSITESGTTRSTFIVNAGSIFFDGTFDPNPGNATHTIPAGNTMAFGVGFSEGLGSSSWYASVDGNNAAYSSNVPVHAFRAPISSGSTHTVMGAGYAGGPLGLQAAYWGYANDSVVCP